MRRVDLEHLLRAAASIAGVADLVVIGSQAILGSYPEWALPNEATRSIEADLAVDAELARLDVATDESDDPSTAGRGPCGDRGGGQRR